MPDTDYPLSLFRFQVDFKQVSLSDHSEQSDVPIGSGGFSECTGLEATMEPKTIRSGGSNYGEHHRAGPVTFGTVVLRRGMTTTRDLWRWFSHINEQGSASYRLNVFIRVSAPGEDVPGKSILVKLFRALPVKFKCADLNANSSEISVEELHLVHEGLTIES